MILERTLLRVISTAIGSITADLANFLCNINSINKNASNLNYINNITNLVIIRRYK